MSIIVSVKATDIVDPTNHNVDRQMRMIAPYITGALNPNVVVVKEEENQFTFRYFRNVDRTGEYHVQQGFGARPLISEDDVSSNTNHDDVSEDGMDHSGPPSDENDSVDNHVDNHEDDDDDNGECEEDDDTDDDGPSKGVKKGQQQGVISIDDESEEVRQMVN